MVRSAPYARVSSVLQEQEGNLARQTVRLKETASERGYGTVQVVPNKRPVSMNTARESGTP